jgi:hypothetical protein
MTILLLWCLLTRDIVGFWSRAIPMYASMFRANYERAAVLRQFDFTTLRLRIVLFEHKHPINQDRRAAKTMMDDVSYKVEEMETDCFCVRKVTIS